MCYRIGSFYRFHRVGRQRDCRRKRCRTRSGPMLQTPLSGSRFSLSNTPFAPPSHFSTVQPSLPLLRTCFLRCEGFLQVVRDTDVSREPRRKTPPPQQVTEVSIPPRGAQTFSRSFLVRWFPFFCNGHRRMDPCNFGAFFFDRERGLSRPVFSLSMSVLAFFSSVPSTAPYPCTGKGRPPAWPVPWTLSCRLFFVPGAGLMSTHFIGPFFHICHIRPYG